MLVDRALMWLAGIIVKLAKRRKPLWIPYRGTRVLIDSPLITFPLLDMLIRGKYEDAEGRALEILGRSGRLGPGDRALELGSGAGVIGLQIAKRTGDANYLGYEANPMVLALAKRNFELNGMAPNIRQKLLLPARGEARSFNVSANFTASSLAERADAVAALPVEADVWDEVIADYDPTFLLMDIEGGEKELILGVRDFGNIRTIVMENHYFDAERPVFEAIVAKLSTAGFREATEIFTSPSVHVFVRG